MVGSMKPSQLVDMYVHATEPADAAAATVEATHRAHPPALSAAAAAAGGSSSDDGGHTPGDHHHVLPSPLPAAGVVA